MASYPNLQTDVADSPDFMPWNPSHGGLILLTQLNALTLMGAASHTMTCLEICLVRQPSSGVP